MSILAQEYALNRWMPNHIHCIITFTKISFMCSVGAALAAARMEDKSTGGTTVSDIIGAYKSLYMFDNPKNWEIDPFYK